MKTIKSACKNNKILRYLAHGLLRFTCVLVLAWSLPIAQAQVNMGTAFDFLPSATSNSVRTDSAHVRLLAWAPEGIAKNKPLWLGLYIQHQPNWHTYWKNPGQAGMPTTMQWQLPPALQAQDMVWATPQTITEGGLINYGYSHDVLLAVPIQVTDNVPTDAPLHISLQADWLACKTACVPQQAQLQVSLPTHQPITQDAQLFAQLHAQTPKDLPNAQASVALQDQQALITVANLPPAWHGKTLNFYPETPQIFATDTPASKQSWKDGVWQLQLPLDAYRKTSPKDIPIVLAMQASAPHNTTHITSNAPNQASYRLVASIQGNWQPAAIVNNTAQDIAPQQPTTAPNALSFGFSLVLAFVGGLILNLMPCVFPVLAIKVLSFARHSSSPSELRLTGYAYTIGVVLSLLALGGVLLILRAGGAALGWGFQLQNPFIVSALGLLFAALGFNFLGWFEIPAIALPSRLGQQRSPAIEAFSSGILTVLVATPCSAPFVGTALAAALVLPAGQALLLFLSMGLGLSVPVLLASIYPKLLAFLPKPGAWMELLRQVMAFFMFATTIWLVWVLGKQSGVDAIALFLLVVLLLAGCLWAWRLHGRMRKWLLGLFAVLLLASGGLHILHLQSNPQAASHTAGNWQAWSPKAVQQALQAKQKVFVEYSAAWCITCQINKQTVLDRHAFGQWAKDNQVLLLRADWTNQDPAITQSLHELGRVSVPTYAVYHPNNPTQPRILGEVISLDAIQQAMP